MLFFNKIKTTYNKIVNKLNDKHTLCFAIFFCLGLLYIILTKKDGHFILNAAPLVAAPALAAAGGGTAGAVGTTAAQTGATAAKTASDLSTGAKMAEGANAGAQGLAPKAGVPGTNPQGVGSPNPDMPNSGQLNKNLQDSSIKKDTAEKKPTLDESTKEKSDSTNEAKKDKKKNKISGGSEETENEEETDFDEGTKELLGKKKNVFFKVLLICLPILLLFLMVLMPLILVTSAASVIDGIFNSSNVKNDGNDFKEIVEKTDEFVIFDSFVVDDKRIEDGIVDEYNKYYSEYGAEINVPLLVTTLFYDVYTEERENNADENVKIARMNARVDAISSLAENMLSIKETKLLCVESLDETGNKTYNFKKVSSQFVESEDKDSIECNLLNLGKSSYKYSREVDYNKYYKYLLESNILTKIYSRKFFGEGTEEEKQKVINEISSSYSMIDGLYFEGQLEGCEEKNKIPYNVLNVMKSPFEGGKYHISSFFGPRYSIGDFHKGIDAYYFDGGEDNVYSAGLISGEVVAVGSSYYSGQYVQIKYVIDGVEYYTYYCHLKEDSILVSKGDILQERQVIAKVGNTGMMPNGMGRVGKHLHFHISKGPSYTINSVYNPIDLYIDASNYTNSCGE